MLLEFEKPIALLEDKLKSLKIDSKDNSSQQYDKAIKKLEKEILSLKNEVYNSLTSWQRVQISRHPQRPYTLDYINNISTNFIEFHGDRLGFDDKSIVGGFGNIDNQTIMFVGHQKGKTTKDRQYRNFGMPNPEGYRKALRLMKLADKFEKPIVCFIDTPGAFPGIEAEERGQSIAIAENIQSMFKLKVPILIIIIGEGASGGALGIGIGDKVAMLENTWYSIISPESCSAILWKNWDFKEQASENLKLISKDLFEMKIIDDIIKEPLGGAHQNKEEIISNVKEYIVNNIQELLKYSTKKLLEKRLKKFCDIGIIAN